MAKSIEFEAKELTFMQWLVLLKKTQINKALTIYKTPQMNAFLDLTNEYLNHKFKQYG